MDVLREKPQRGKPLIKATSYFGKFLQLIFGLENLNPILKFLWFLDCDMPKVMDFSV